MIELLMLWMTKPSLMAEVQEVATVIGAGMVATEGAARAGETVLIGVTDEIRIEGALTAEIAAGNAATAEIEVVAGALTGREVWTKSVEETGAGEGVLIEMMGMNVATVKITTTDLNLTLDMKKKSGIVVETGFVPAAPHLKCAASVSSYSGSKMGLSVFS